MEYLKVNPDETLLDATCSPDTLALIYSGKYEIFMMAGMEDGNVLCYAIFSHIPGKGREVYLEYLFTTPGRREEGLCTGLLKYCDKYLKERGIDSILSKFFMKPVYAQEYNSFMVNRGFVPLNVTGRMLHYRLKDMLDSGTIQTMIKARKKLPPIKSFKSVGEQQIKALLSRYKETGFTFVREEADEKYSRFFMESEIIDGAIIASRPSEDTLYISALYMDRLAEKRNMFLSLFSECVAPICAELEENDIKIIIMINSENIYNGLLDVFNPPEQEFLVLEHMKYFGRD